MWKRENEMVSDGLAYHTWRLGMGRESIIASRNTRSSIAGVSATRYKATIVSTDSSQLARSTSLGPLGLRFHIQ